MPGLETGAHRPLGNDQSLHDPRFCLVGGRVQSVPLCYPPQSLSCDSPLSVGSHSRSEKPEGILNYYHGGKKTGGCKVRLLGLNLNFLTVLP